MSNREALTRLANALVEDILATHDEDILAEFLETHGSPTKNADEILRILENAFRLTIPPARCDWGDSDNPKETPEFSQPLSPPTE